MGGGVATSRYFCVTLLPKPLVFALRDGWGVKNLRFWRYVICGRSLSILTIDSSVMRWSCTDKRFFVRVCELQWRWGSAENRRTNAQNPIRDPAKNKIKHKKAFGETSKEAHKIYGIQSTNGVTVLKGTGWTYKKIFLTQSKVFETILLAKIFYDAIGQNFRGHHTTLEISDFGWNSLQFHFSTHAEFSNVRRTSLRTPTHTAISKVNTY